MAKWRLIIVGVMGGVVLGGLLSWLTWGVGVQANTLSSGVAVPNPTAIVLQADDGTYLCAPPRADNTRDCSIVARAGKTVVASWQARTPQDKKLDMQTRTTVFRLQERAQLEFKLLTNDVERIIHYAGRLFVSHDPDGRDKITVEAGTTRVDAIDTRFTVVRTGNTVLVAVPRDGGTVTVTLPNGTTQRVTSGQQITIGSGRGQGRVVPISAAEQSYWTALLRDWATIPGILPSAIRIPQRLPSPTPNPAPAVAPVPVSPANNADIYTVAQAINVPFTWQPITYPGPVKYGIEIEMTAANSTIPVASNANLTNTSYSLPIAQGDAHNYRWRVWALSPTGAPGPKSSWFTFTTRGTIPIN